ncbi:hypothetical protein [Marinomonas colpomeniae]|uniref:Uncharacterized protein n=1 Tax=Marinomonas colpomeniae TaxID=2774408 RepID=A0ABR8P2N3_9GAMM|nr:hypothetical protein [Marinomonas colpomeniae]MBD5772438.1 hypothetical protein [Marinomonas colpomeniae]
MEELLLNADEKIHEIIELVSQLQHRIGNNDSFLHNKEIRNSLDRFNRAASDYNNYNDSAKNGSSKESTIYKLIEVPRQGVGLGFAILKSGLSDGRVSSLSTELVEKSNDLLAAAGYNSLSSNGSTGLDSFHSFKSAKNQLNELFNQSAQHDDRVKKLLNENEVKITQISERSKQLESEMKAEIEKVSVLYSDSLKEIEVKESQINDILGHASGRVIAGDFETSAGDEKAMANVLRYASLVCMAITVAIVTFSFYETTQASFEWKSSLFRIVLAIMLSIPAAYLARESAKHRAQQYEHQQTSLDLKAITPYIASLPEEEQHKIKIEIANRLFAARDFTKTNIDSYPINTHELMMELIKKLDTKKD